MRRNALLGGMALALTIATGLAVQAQDPTELRLTWWGSQNRHDKTIAVVEMYEAANPDVDIVYEFANFNDYWTKLNTQAAGNELPCVMQQDYAYLAEWANRGLLMPLDSFVETGTIDLSDAAEVAVQGGIVDEQLYGVSLGTNSQSIIIDVDVFEEAGLELPATDWTWADFEEIANTIHEKTGKWALTLGRNSGLSDIQLWKSLYLAYGEAPFNEEGTGLGYENDQPLVDYFSMLLRLQEAGVIASLEEVAAFEDAGPEASPIVTGQAAMAYQWSNQVIAVYSAAGEDRNLRLWPLPRPEGQAPANYLKPSMFFSIPSSCEHAEQAADFINFFTNSLEANDILLAERGVPISSKVQEYLLPKLDPANAETFEFLKIVEADSSPIFAADPPGFGDFRTNVWIPLFIEPVFYGQTTLEEGIATLRSEAEAIFSQNAN